MACFRQLCDRIASHVTVPSMITLVVLVAVAVMSVGGGWLAFRELRGWRRAASLVAAVASIGSAASFLRLVQVYNSRPLEIVTATRNPLAGLAPWDLLALLLGLIAIATAGLGVKRARILLLASGILMFCFTLLVLTEWD
jgi:hypothetical protein